MGKRKKKHRNHHQKRKRIKRHVCHHRHTPAPVPARKPIFAPDTVELFRTRLNEVARLVINNATAIIGFVLVFLFAIILQKVTGVLVAADSSLKGAAALVGGLSYILLIVDVLWLTAILIPWLGPVKKWIKRERVKLKRESSR